MSFYVAGMCVRKSSPHNPVQHRQGSGGSGGPRALRDFFLLDLVTVCPRWSELEPGTLKLQVAFVGFMENCPCHQLCPAWPARTRAGRWHQWCSLWENQLRAQPLGRRGRVHSTCRHLVGNAFRSPPGAMRQL